MNLEFDISDFLAHARMWVVLDVRTPAEYEAGHIPGALNLPLFTNEERALIGTLYNRQGRSKAVLKGLEFVGPRMKNMVEEAKKLSQGNPVLLHCWRGGMRSSSVAWLLNLSGMEAHTLKKGYKAFRQWALRQFAAERNMMILGGYTGSSKTPVLHELKELGEQVVDLEALAHHKGSAFGAIGELPQPTQEDFENRLAWALSETDPEKPVWLEDESLSIGKKIIPEMLWKQMRSASLIFMDIPQQKRARYLAVQYGSYSKEELRNSILKLQKRLGGLAMKEALVALDAGALQQAAEILLNYYDKAYLYGVSQRQKDRIHHFAPESEKPAGIAEEIRKFALSCYA